MATCGTNDPRTGTETLAVFFVAAGVTDEASFRRAAEALGGAFRPASTFLTSFAAGRTHDGAGGYRLVAFNDSCACFAYRSAVRAMP